MEIERARRGSSVLSLSRAPRKDHRRVTRCGLERAARHHDSRPTAEQSVDGDSRLPSRISGRSNGLRRASHKPVIDQFIAGGFRKLRDDPPNLLVAGAAMQPWRLVKGEVADVCDLAGFRAFTQPGFVLAVVSFELEQTEKGICLSTETRVQPTDSRAGLAFLPYWLVIRAGSGLIRREMLRAVARRSGLQ